MLTGSTPDGGEQGRLKLFLGPGAKFFFVSVKQEKYGLLQQNKTIVLIKTSKTNV